MTANAARPPKASFLRWVRSTSEHHLLVVAQRRLAARYGTPPPPPPRGAEIFWQRIYAPVFYLLPYPLRARIADTLPGSHQQRWHKPDQASGPAV